MNSIKPLEEHFYNIDIKYPHEYEEGQLRKIYNVKKEYNFYDYLVIFMLGGFGVIVVYNMIDSMEEKGYMLVIVFFILFCGLLG
jgi:hypothetical protein